MRGLIVGLGSIGCRHARNLHDMGVEELAVLRTRHSKPPADAPPNLKVFTNTAEAMAASPDFVVIANPSSLHFGIMKAAVTAGCHVYVEKPVSTSLEGLIGLSAQANAKNLKIMVGCQRRFHPISQQIKTWLADGKIGKTISVQMDSGEYLVDWHPWEDYRQGYAARKDLGGGVVLTQIHDLDLIYWWFGRIERVFGLGGQLTPLTLDVTDTALVTMMSQTGIPIQLRTDYWRKPHIQEVSIVGTEGSIQADFISGSVSLIDRSEKINHLVFSDFDRNSMFRDAMKGFISAIKKDANPPITLNDGIDVLHLALAIESSISLSRVEAL